MSGGDGPIPPIYWADIAPVFIQKPLLASRRRLLTTVLLGAKLNFPKDSFPAALVWENSPSFSVCSGCEGFAAHAMGGDAGDAEYKPANSEHLSDDEYVSDTEGTPQPPSSSSLNLDTQDMRKHAATSLSIPWPSVQSKAIKSQLDDKKLWKAEKMRKQMLPIFLNLLEEISVTSTELPYNEKQSFPGSFVGNHYISAHK